MKVFDLVKIAGVLIVVGIWLDVIKSATGANGKLNILTQKQLNAYIGRERFEPFEPIVVDSILRDFSSRNVQGKVVNFDLSDIQISEPQISGLFSAVFDREGAFSTRISFNPRFKFTDTFSITGARVVVKANGRTKAQSRDAAIQSVDIITSRVRSRLNLKDEIRAN